MLVREAAFAMTVNDFKAGGSLITSLEYLNGHRWNVELLYPRIQLYLNLRPEQVD